MAKSNRVPGVSEAPKTPAQAIIAASAMITAPVGPTSAAAASASGRSELARLGSATTQTSCISEYSTMKTIIETPIANGTDRDGLRTSPANTPVASKPMKANAASNTALDTFVTEGTAPRFNAEGLRNHSPTATNPTSGTSL